MGEQRGKVMSKTNFDLFKEKLTATLFANLMECLSDSESKCEQYCPAHSECKSSCVYTYEDCHAFVYKWANAPAKDK